MNYTAKLSAGLSYRDFLARHGSEGHRMRWEGVHTQVSLTAAQRATLADFTRVQHAFVLAGAWCGDCVDQCPIFDHFAAATDQLKVLFFDRDAHPDLAAELSVCGGQRVPAVLFLSEDLQPCGRYGDRTLARYRHLAAAQMGAACPTGLVAPEQSLLNQVTAEWLDQFERIQWMLRLSPRLRQKHGD